MGTAAVVENKLSGGGAANAHLLFLLAEGESGRPFLHDEGAGAAGSLCGVGERDYGVYLSLAAVGDELLGAVEHIAIAVALGGRLDSSGVAAGPGLCEPEGGEPGSAGYSREILLLLFFAGIKKYGESPQSVGGISERYAGAGAAQFLNSDAEGKRSLAHALVLFGNEDSEQVGVSDIFDYLPGELLFLVQFGTHGEYPLLGDSASYAFDELLLFG